MCTHLLTDVEDRIVLLIDLDYFYAQCEEIRHPEFRGRPVAVCIYSGRTENSGAVSTANYEARRIGIRSGIPIIAARRMATQDTVFLKADLDYYDAVSMRLMSLLRMFSQKMEQASVDEAYLELRGKSYEEAEEIARQIKELIRKSEGLTCSIGIGKNKLIAKMASGVNKPDGLTVVRPEEVDTFLLSKKPGDLYGVGKVTESKLSEMGIETIAQLRDAPLSRLQSVFGSSMGLWLYNASRGIDDSPVEERKREQYGRIVTLKENTRDRDTLIQEASRLVPEVISMVQEDRQQFRTLSFIGILEDLSIRTKNRTLNEPTDNAQDVYAVLPQLIDSFLSEHTALIRRIGIKVSNLSEKKGQKKLLDFS